MIIVEHKYKVIRDLEGKSMRLWLEATETI